ncbi:MAG: hypothetical protein QG665_412 [Patescibacteria group bacterium]|nr:hypothetical protein [Patescibacteria group bacterium]
MKKHISELLKFCPNLLSATVLDVGAGRGKFIDSLLEVNFLGTIKGFEPAECYVSELRAKFSSVPKVEIIRGVAESIPFENNQFDFLNVSEVVEHVESPQKTLQEIYRVLKPGGCAYISVPSRFAIFDPHFHLWFVNWMPRTWSDFFIKIFGRHKDYNGAGGRHRLGEMHYFTYRKFIKLCLQQGFVVTDTRRAKIVAWPIPKRLVGIFLYSLVKNFYFQTFHFFLNKPSN